MTVIVVLVCLILYVVLL